MKAVELLHAAQVDNWFARMEDGSYRWVDDDLRLLDGGPDPTWVEHAIRTTDTSGLPEAGPVPDHDEALRELNEKLGAPGQEGPQ